MSVLHGCAGTAASSVTAGCLQQQTAASLMESRWMKPGMYIRALARVWQFTAQVRGSCSGSLKPTLMGTSHDVQSPMSCAQQAVDSSPRTHAEVACICAGGKLLGKIAVGEVSNLVFAGDVLVMLQEKEVTAAKLAVKGPPLPGMFEAVS